MYGKINEMLEITKCNQFYDNQIFEMLLEMYLLVNIEKSIILACIS